MQIDMGIFDKILEEDENLEWVAKPEPFNLLDKQYKRNIFTKWIVCFIVMVLMTGGYFLSITSSNTDFMFFMPIITVGMPLLIAILPFFDIRGIQKNYIFALTNKRVIVSHDEQTQLTLDLDQIKDVKIFERENGVGDVAFGSIVTLDNPYKLLRYAAVPDKEFVNDKEYNIGIAFINVPEVLTIKKHLSGDITITENIAS